MKKVMVFLSLVGIVIVLGAEMAEAQSTHPQEVLTWWSNGGHPFGPARIRRNEAAIRHGWAPGVYPGAMPGQYVFPRQQVVVVGNPGYRGGFFGGGYHYGGGYFGDYYGWSSVAREGIRTTGDYLINRNNNDTIRQVESQRVHLEERRIDNEHELALRRENRADQKLQMELRREDVELRQLEGGRYVPQQLGTSSQASAPASTPRTLYNRSGCEVSGYLDNNLAFVLPPNGVVPILDGGYDLEAEGCSIQLKDAGDDVYIVPGR